MSADSILVIDAGTSALRAVAVRGDGAVTPLASEPWPMSVPADAAPFGREYDAEAVETVLSRLVDAAAPLRGRLAAVAVAGQREGLAFADGDGAAVCLSPNVDARAAAEGIGIDAARAAEVYAVTGHLPSLMQAAAKLTWLRRRRPGDAAGVRWVLPLADWIALRLGGAAAMSRSLAAESGLLDITTGEIAAAHLAAGGFDVRLLAPLVADGKAAGEVRRGALAGVPVVHAGADTQCALAGMGAIADGDCGVPVGWSAPVQLVTSRAVFDGRRRTWTGVHVVPGAWILESNASETGRAWEWMCAMLGVTAAEADDLAEASPAGSRDAMAVLGARAMDAARMSAGVGGVTLPLPLVMSAPGRGDLLRAVLEATAYAVRANVEQIEEIAGRRIERLRLGGGMSRSAMFTRILTDVLDRPVEVARGPETSALGAAALAAAGVGLHRSIGAAVEVMAGGRRTIEPRPRASAAYDDCYGRWCAMCDAFARMAGEAG